MKPRKDLSGKRIGELAVIKGLELSDPLLGNKEPTLYKTYLCKCSCGKEAVMTSRQLTYGALSCGCLRSIANTTKKLYVGLKINRLTVVRFDVIKRQWEFVCDCGNQYHSGAKKILSENTKSCGCLNTEKRSKNAIILLNNKSNPNPIEILAMKIHRDRYSDGDLSFEDFFRLSQLPCFYCDATKTCKTIKKPSKHSYLSKLPIEQLTFSYNGLDRINSNLPHNLDNCVSSCFICNHAKSDFGIQAFVEYITNLISHTIIHSPEACRELATADLLLFTDKAKFSVCKSIRHTRKQNYNDADFTIDKFYQLTQLPCYYCGAKSSNLMNRAKQIKKSSQFAKDTGDFRYNGLDRIDSTKGHILTNVVPCCKYCNRAKNSLSLIKFLEWIQRIRDNFPTLIENISLQYPNSIVEFK